MTFLTGPRPGVVPDARHSTVRRRENANGAQCCNVAVCSNLL